MNDINQAWILWAILLAITAFALWAERLRWGARTSAVAITLLTAMLLSYLGLIPGQSAIYDVIRTYLVPLAIPMLILKADVLHGWRDLGMVGGAMALNILAAIGATLLVAGLVPESLDSGRWINSTVTGFIGGQSSNPIHALLLALYLVVLFLLPSIRSFRRWFHEPIPDNWWGSTVEVLITERRKGSQLYLPSIALTLAISAVICTLAYSIAPKLGMTNMELLLIAAVSLVLSLVLPKHIARLSGAEDIGILIMLLLFAVIGASADFSVVTKQPTLLAITALALLVQTAILLILGKYLHLSLPQLLIAANAGVGGATSATAMAAARRWHTLVFPAVLYATFGQLLAAPIARALANWFH